MADNKKMNETVRRNKAAVMCYIITISVIAAAYLLESIKGNRSWGYFALVFFTLAIPGAVTIIMQKTGQYIDAIKYVILFGFAIPWAIMLFTKNNNLVFTYALVLMIALNAYADKKFALYTAIVFNIISVASVVVEALSTGLDQQGIVTAEIQILLLLLCGIFNIFVAGMGAIINKEKLDNIEVEKNHASSLLDTVLSVSREMTDDIGLMNIKMKDLSDAMDRTCSAMEEVTTGTSVTTDSIQTQIVMTEEIQKRLDEVTKHADEISKNVTETGKAISLGSVNMGNLEKEVKDSDRFSNDAATALGELENATQQMQTIVDLINNVADQTSLLALNASIEAARAGEAGRGFSVVAGEISSLANQTQEATGDISNLINSIGDKLADVDKAIRAFIDSSKRQHDATMETVRSLDIIKNDAANIERSAGGLNGAVSSLAESNKGIVDAVQSISAIMEEVTAHTKETYESSQHNSATVNEMMNIMDHLNDQAVSMKQKNI